MSTHAEREKQYQAMADEERGAIRRWVGLGIVVLGAMFCLLKLWFFWGWLP